MNPDETLSGMEIHPQDEDKVPQLLARPEHIQAGNDIRGWQQSLASVIAPLSSGGRVHRILPGDESIRGILLRGSNHFTLLQDLHAADPVHSGYVVQLGISDPG